jgi:uncharacterized protein (TIGR02246 family)
MTRAAIVCLAVVFIAAPTLGDDSQAPNPEALQLAKQLTSQGAATFDTRNAVAMAAYYTEDAEVTLVGKDSQRVKLTVYRGRSEIEKLYEGLFKNAEAGHAKNTVEHARFIGQDMLLITGTFEPGGGDLKVPFVQVRMRQDGKWLMMSCKVFVVGENG